MVKYSKGFLEITSYSLIADMLFVFIVILTFSMIFAIYLNSDSQISASEIAKTIGFTLKQVVAGGDGTKIQYFLPARDCKVEITKEKIYVATDTKSWDFFLRSGLNKIASLFASLVGIELGFGIYEIPNPVGNYIVKDYELKCYKTFRKKLIFSYENNVVNIISVS